jgi:uncharacterized repeat protein (TIGR03803 family)
MNSMSNALSLFRIRFRSHLTIFLLSAGVVVGSFAHAQVIWTFDGSKPNGAMPQSDVTEDAAGNLYGTTERTSSKLSGGTVYKLIPQTNGTWIEKVIYRFLGGADGSRPMAGVVIDKSGDLWGTTYAGGVADDGILYELTPQGHEYIRVNFDGDIGANPAADLFVDSSGNFWGTTTNGGAQNLGVVFSYNPSTGALKTVYTFKGGKDGAHPSSALIADSAGNLYGVTLNGGGSTKCSEGCGTIYKLSPTGQEEVLHRFTGIRDGAAPSGKLTIDASGNLYGTAQKSGAPCVPPYKLGKGTVFELMSNHTFETLFSLRDETGEPQKPAAGVFFDSVGNLYGITELGGGSDKGALFKLAAGHSCANELMTVLYSFSQATGYGIDTSVSADSHGNLFVTAPLGGPGQDAAGTVLNLTP